MQTRLLIRNSRNLSRYRHPGDNPFYSTIDSMPDIRPRRKSIPLVSELVGSRLPINTVPPLSLRVYTRTYTHIYAHMYACAYVQVHRVHTYIYVHCLEPSVVHSSEIITDPTKRSRFVSPASSSSSSSSSGCCKRLSSPRRESAPSGDYARPDEFN